jgi:hypothetical protein
MTERNYQFVVQVPRFATTLAALDELDEYLTTLDAEVERTDTTRTVKLRIESVGVFDAGYKLRETEEEVRTELLANGWNDPTPFVHVDGGSQ